VDAAGRQEPLFRSRRGRLARASAKRHTPRKTGGGRDLGRGICAPCGRVHRGTRQFRRSPPVVSRTGCGSREGAASGRAVLIYILDTNILSALRRPERAPHVGRWLGGKPDDALYLSVVTLGEIERGIALQDRKDQGFADDLRRWLDRTLLLFSDRILPFDADAARIWGRLSARIGNAGADLQIAATALSRNATIVTSDKAFQATGARVEDPFPGTSG
jgi:toxin FitB